MESEPLTERIKTYRDEYNKQRATLKKIEEEREGEWQLSNSQLTELVQQLKEEI